MTEALCRATSRFGGLTSGLESDARLDPRICRIKAEFCGEGLALVSPSIRTMRRVCFFIVRVHNL